MGKETNGRNPRVSLNRKRPCVKASTEQIFNSIWDGIHFIQLYITSDLVHTLQKTKKLQFIRFGT